MLSCNRIVATLMLMLLTIQIVSVELNAENLIDRTSPTILETGANPMNLSPASDVPFTTTIVYKIQDESECTASVTITNQSTGEVVATYNPAPANANANRKLPRMEIANIANKNRKLPRINNANIANNSNANSLAAISASSVAISDSQ